jgi:tetratricopeptide (TPR) repeat protein
MKLINTFILIQITIVCFGQTVDEKIADEACNCFHLNSASDRSQFMSEFMEKCVKVSFFKYKDEIIKTFDIKDTTDYSLGYDLGKKIAPKIFSSLIMNCDKFYFYFDSLRWSGKSTIDKSKVEQDLIKAKKDIKIDRTNSINYFLGGMAYFQLDEYKKAKRNFEKSIELNDTYGPAYLYLGWIKEIKGDFIGAKLDYEKSFNLIGKSEIILLVAIAERKERERNARQHKL